MSGHNPLRKALLKRFNRIALVQRPERWRRLEGTAAGGADGMTPRAMGLRDGSALVHVLRMGQTGTDKERQQAQVNDSGHGIFSTGFAGISGGLAASANPAPDLNPATNLPRPLRVGFP